MSSDDDENVNDDFLLQKCIQDGMQAMMRTSQTETQPSSVCGSRTVYKENPLGMFRKGALVDATADETSPFQVEGSPCNFSIASGFSDLTIGSNKAGVMKPER